MKIRQDFVTNSSSVIYIVTFCPSLYNSKNDYYWRGREDKKDIKYSRIEELIKKIFESGTKVYWEDCELYVKKYEFNTEETTTDDVYEKQNEEIDFKVISENDLWNYIRGQFFIMSDLGHIYGFGVTQVETY